MARKYEQLELRLTPTEDGTKIEYIHHGRRKKTYLSRTTIAGDDKDAIRAQHDEDFKTVLPRLRLPTGVKR